jgi:hypothetical protein
MHVRITSDDVADAVLVVVDEDGPPQKRAHVPNKTAANDATLCKP